MLLPFQVVADGAAQVFSFLYFLEDLSAHGVKAFPWCSSADPQYVALLWVESHAPFLCPVLEGGKVLLECELEPGDTLLGRSFM